jgi:hypothetical protein
MKSKNFDSIKLLDISIKRPFYYGGTGGGIQKVIDDFLIAEDYT